MGFLSDVLNNVAKLGRSMYHRTSSLICLLLAIVIFLSGCTVKFYYNQLDWLVPWHVDDYVELTAEQEVIFDNHLDEYLEWHRTEQLPVYADFLSWAASASSNGFDESELQRIQTKVNEFTATMFTRLAPVLVDLFPSFSEEQVNELFDNFDENNLEYKEENIDISEVKHREDRAKELTRFIERWTGELDEPQLLYIEEWSQQYTLMSADFLTSRKQWQKELKRILQRRDDRNYLQEALLDLFARRYSMRSAQYQEKYQQNEQLLKSLYASLDRSLTSHQREKMITKFMDIADDFRYLSKKG
jgi:hypothetical protein